MENVLLEKSEHIGILTISRPRSLNALNSQTLKEIRETVESISMDKDIYALIITGLGERAFAAGADISEMKELDVFEARKFSVLGNELFRRIELLEIPVIAAVNGFALGGGCELALCCDIRIAGEGAKFGQPEVTLGITPGFGGTQRLARIAGIGKAKELIFTGAVIDSEEALRIGLVNKVVPVERLMDEALSMAKKIASNAPIAVRYSKSAINRGIQCDMDTGIMYEAESFAQCFASQDQRDAMNAFVEKRKLEKFSNR